jgi:hypothetical protein
MLDYLACALFGVLMIVCLRYVMISLETEEAPPDEKH